MEDSQDSPNEKNETDVIQDQDGNFWTRLDSTMDKALPFINALFGANNGQQQQPWRQQQQQQPPQRDPNTVLYITGGVLLFVLIIVFLLMNKKV